MWNQGPGMQLQQNACEWHLMYPLAERKDTLQKGFVMMIIGSPLLWGNGLQVPIGQPWWHQDVILQWQ